MNPIPKHLRSISDVEFTQLAKEYGLQFDSSIQRELECIKDKTCTTETFVELQKLLNTVIEGYIKAQNTELEIQEIQRQRRLLRLQQLEKEQKYNFIKMLVLIIATFCWGFIFN